MKKTFDTLRNLVAWLESCQGKNIEVCDHADDAGWQSAEDALASYREILDHSSEDDIGPVRHIQHPGQALCCV